MRIEAIKMKQHMETYAQRSIRLCMEMIARLFPPDRQEEDGQFNSLCAEAVQKKKIFIAF